MKEMLTQKMQKNISRKLVSYDEDIHELLDMIDDSVNTSDCHTPQEPAKPTHSFVDLPKPPAASPPVEAMKEELENESSQQACDEKSGDVISVEENLQAENMQCINYLSSEFLFFDNCAWYNLPTFRLDALVVLDTAIKWQSVHPK